MEVHVQEHEGDGVALRMADAVGADLVVGIARAAVGRGSQGAVVHREDGIAACKEMPRTQNKEMVLLQILNRVEGQTF